MAFVKITRGCSRCGCPSEKIEYKNCGPIIYIRCPECCFGMKEGRDTPLGELVPTWNAQPYTYAAKLQCLYDAQESHLAVRLRYDGNTEITGIVTIVKAQNSTFTIEMPGEFVYEGLEIDKVDRVERIHREIPAIKEGRGVKIWLDDVREAPQGYELVRSVYEAQALIEQIEAEGGRIEVLDLDHDLGDYACHGGDGIKLLYYLIYRETFYPVKLHTANPVGRNNMQSMIDRYWP